MTEYLFARMEDIEEIEDILDGIADIVGLTPTDGAFIVGNGTAFVTESGATARTSLGLGTTDSPTFVAVTVDDLAYNATTWNGSQLVPTRNAIRDYLETLTGTTLPATYQPLDAELTAIAALAVTDGNFIVGNGSTWVVESGNTARTSLGLGTGDSPTFTGLSLTGALTDVAGGAVFNEAGADVDFRIEGDTNANLFFLDASTDRVGIGTASPGTLLDVNGAATVRGILNVNNGTTTGGAITLGTNANSVFDSTSGTLVINSAQFVLNINGSTVFNEAGSDTDWRMEGDTNVNLFFLDASADAIGLGTGTLNSNNRLAISGATSESEGTGRDQGQLIIQDSDNTDSGLIIGYRYQAAVNEYARIQARNSSGATNIIMQGGGGNLGIGGAPGCKFHVYGTDDVPSVIVGGSARGVRIFTTAATAQIEGVDETGFGSYEDLIIGGASLQFTISGAVRATLDSSGNFGIGTAGAPNAMLDVRGTVIFNDAGGDFDVRMEGDTNANLFFLDASTDRIGNGTASPQLPYHIERASGTSGFRLTSGSGSADFTTDGTSTYLTNYVSGGAIAFTASGSGSVTFTTNSNERMRIDGSGNVGIGATPVAKFQIGNNVATSFMNNFSEYQILLYEDSSASGSYGIGIRADTMIFNSGAGNFAFDIAGASTGVLFTNVANIKVSGSATRGTTEGTNQLVLFNGTAPAGALTNGVSFYSASGEAFAMNANGVATRLTFAAHSNIGTGTKTISNAASSSTNFGNYLIASVNGTTLYIPCGTVAPT